MSENLKKSENPNFTRNEKGQSRFAKGNKIGRMKKKGYTLADLTKIVMKYEKTHPNEPTILQHYIDRIKKNDKLLQDFINKYVPTKNINELTGAGGEPISITLKEIVYGKDENKAK